MKLRTLRPYGLIHTILAFLLLAFRYGSADACNAPILLNTFNVTTSDVSLTWTAVSPPPGAFFEVELVIQGQNFSGNPTYSNIYTVPFAVSGLISGKQYQFRVRTVCAVGDVSAWSTARKFRTDLTNPSLCPLDLALADTSCAPATNQFEISVANAPGSQLGTDVFLKSVRLIVQHSWLDDLSIALTAPDGTRLVLVDSLGTGEDNLGNPLSSTCGEWTEFSAQCGSVSIYSPQATPPYIGTFLPKNNLSGFNTGGMANGIWNLEICDAGADDVGKLVYVELVFYRPDCRPPSNLTVSNITLTGAQLAWSAPIVTCDSVLIEYGPHGFRPGNTSTAGTGGTLRKLACPEPSFVLLSSLQPLTEYDVYVRRVCGAGIYSDNSCVSTFFTDCAAPTLEENFDNLSNCSTACGAPCAISGIFTNISSGDQFDWTVYSAPTPTANTGPDADADGNGGKYAYIETSGAACTGGKMAILRSNCIAVNAQPGGCHLSFFWHLFGATVGSLRLEISTNAGQTWTTIFQKTGNQGNQWNRQYLDLSAYDGQIAVFRFVGVGGSGPYGDIGIDNIRFFGSTDAGAPDYVFYADADGDGFGNPAHSIVYCSPNAPPGYVTNNQDCNDLAASLAPGKPEILCDQIDQNCNGMADDQYVPAPTVLSDTAICFGQNLSIQALSAPLGQFYWYDAPTGGNIVATGPSLSFTPLTGSGVYYLIDSLSGNTAGCASARVPVAITAHPVPYLANINPQALCIGKSLNLASLPIVDYGQTNGTISFHDNYPPDPSNRLGSAVVSPSANTVYQILSTTNYGCEGVTSVLVEVNSLPSVQISTGDSLDVCLGSTVNLSGYASGGSGAPYSYTWSNGVNFQNITVPSNASPGFTDILILQGTDTKGCSNTDSIRIFTLPSISQTQINSVQQVTECGGSDGSIQLTPLNGFSPYRLTWEGPVGVFDTLFPVSGTASINNLPQGLYRVTVTDYTAQGCSMVLPLVSISAPGLTAEIDSIQAASCYGYANGAITLNVSGNAPQYQWSNSITTEDNLFIPKGLYAVTITDGACQVIFSNLKIQEPPPIEVIENQIDMVSCHGSSDGAVDVILQGGTPPYEILWSNDAITEDITNVPAGFYNSIITDAHGCILESNPSYVSEPPPLILQNIATTPISCHGGNNGFLLVQASGGAGEYRYQWSTGHDGPFLANLSAGNYSVTVTDKNGCTKSTALSLANPDSLYFFQITAQNPACQGLSTGAIFTNVVGGTGDYQFLWSQGGGGSSASGLNTGVYGVTVVDSKGCSDTANNIVLTAPQVLSMQIDTLAPVHCYGEFTGTAGISIAGGTTPYAIFWNFDAGSTYRDDLPAGLLRIRIRDYSGCEFLSDTIYISQPAAPLSLEISALENPICNNDFGGSIDILTQGGTVPYSYLWSNGEVEEDLTEIRHGTFFVHVVDARGCEAQSDTVTIIEPPAIAVVVTKEDVPCFGPQTGKIELTVTGGIPPYTYNWSSGQQTEDIYNISEGIYDITITDFIGCQHILKSITVYKSSLEFIAIPVEVNNVSCNGQSDGSVIVKAIGGTGPYYFNWSPPGGLHFSSTASDTLSGMDGGHFNVTVTDFTGCVAISDTLAIQESPPLELNYTGVTNPFCAGDSTGSITTHAAGGQLPYQYLWSNGSTEPQLMQIPAGCYALTVVDFNGCAVQGPIACLEDNGTPLQIVLDTQNGGIIHDNCAACKGAIRVTVSGGLPNYVYEWNTFSDQQDISNLCPGAYQLTVWDQHGCSHTSPVYEVLEGENPLQFDSVQISDVRCFGEANGQVVTYASGGTEPYNYVWNQGSLADTLAGLTGGNYTVTLSDVTGCSLVYGVVVHAPDSMLQATVQTVSEAGGTWCATIEPSGGTAPYQFIWSTNDTSATVCGLNSGNYGAVVTDWHGCILYLNPVHVPVATASPEIIENWRLRPNPAHDFAVLENSENAQEPVSVRVVNSLGVSVFAHDYSGGKMKLPTAEWVPGMYFVYLTLADGRGGCMVLVVE